jgi:hypothetical protein
MAAATRDHWTRVHSIGLLVVVVIIVLVGLSAANLKLDPNAPAPAHWYGTMLLLLLFIVIAGHGTCGRLFGFLIDERNKMTLSRLQLILWTVLVLSAYLTVVLARIESQGIAALSVAIPQQVWWLLGISTASMVGSPLILSNKKQQVVDAKEKERNVSLLAAEVTADQQPAGDKKPVGTIGAVVVNASPRQARFADLFRGDETGNGTSLDLGKVQMFFFTIVIVLTYAFVLGKGFSGMLGATAEFPPLDQGMVALLGISHAGYLSHKAVPHSARSSDNVELGETPDPPPKE